MKTYAIWKDRKVIGYINLTEEQVNILNKNTEIGLYFGFDRVTNPERYELLERFLDVSERKGKAIIDSEEYNSLQIKYDKLFFELERMA